MRALWSCFDVLCIGMDEGEDLQEGGWRAMLL